MSRKIVVFFVRRIIFCELSRLLLDDLSHLHKLFFCETTRDRLCVLIGHD